MEPTTTSAEVPTQSTASPSETIDSISIHFIDVGQGDSILIKAGSEAMMIDAGNPGDKDEIIDYLEAQNVDELDYLIGTHPHADHIGGMDDIIDTFPINTILMPDVTSNTNVFENILDSVDRKGITITVPEVGDNYNLSAAQFTVLAPNGSGYEDLNNDSIVIRLVFKETSFLFVGDAEDISEREMLNNEYELDSDLLKVGHHGSDYSSSAPFLNAVSPKYAVISVGEGNSYGHPTAGALARLASVGAEVYRTDLSGTIVATSDGTNITLDKSVSPIKTTAPPVVSNTPVSSDKDEVTVYITNSGEKYHADGCRYLSKSKIPISLDDACAKGYEPCKVCKPPTK